MLTRSSRRHGRLVASTRASLLNRRSRPPRRRKPNRRLQPRMLMTRQRKRRKRRSGRCPKIMIQTVIPIRNGGFPSGSGRRTRRSVTSGVPTRAPWDAERKVQPLICEYHLKMFYQHTFLICVPCICFKFYFSEIPMPKKSSNQPGMVTGPRQQRPAVQKSKKKVKGKR